MAANALFVVLLPLPRDPPTDDRDDVSSTERRAAEDRLTLYSVIDRARNRGDLWNNHDERDAKRAWLRKEWRAR